MIEVYKIIQGVALTKKLFSFSQNTRIPGCSVKLRAVG